MQFTSISICGSGTMGSGIAQLSAMSGLRTTLFDLNTAVLNKARANIEENLQLLVNKNKIATDNRDQYAAAIHYTTELENCKSDIVIEAIIESIDDKVVLFNQLASINDAQTILASNTSSLSVSAIAKEVSGPQRVAGFHFFNPATLMKLVEVVQAETTAPETIQTLIALAKRLGKTPVVCKDSPGFIVNRVARPYYLEALRIAEQYGLPFNVIDGLLEKTGFKMGPFRLMDLIGNDVNYAVSKSVYSQMNNPERLRPSEVQAQRVDKGELGRKTGRGYYEYN